MSQFRSGFVALLGRPNVGKSTLLNNILEEKIAIVTDKPQTTRNRIVGIKNSPASQLILVDTPGLHTPRGKLNEALVEASKSAWRDADLALIILEASASRLRRGEREIMTHAVSAGIPFLVAINKIDLLPERDGDSLKELSMYTELLREYELDSGKIHFLSARDGVGVASLVCAMEEQMPHHPAYFPDDVQTERMRFRTQLRLKSIITRI